MSRDSYMDTRAYMKSVPKIFREVRKEFGDDLELLHDVHERIEPDQALRLMQELEQYRPYWIEDPVSPENNAYLEQLNTQSNVPIAMGELYNNPHEWLTPIKNRWIKFIRCHISQTGGITPAMKIARLGEWFNVLTAWHGPPDCSPIGHAANAHIDLAVWNFGLQEPYLFPDKIREVFPGAPTFKDGFMYVNEAPGLGVDIDEKKAAKYPLPQKDLDTWTQLRKNDGTPNRP
jgi:mannonate dehydratase